MALINLDLERINSLNSEINSLNLTLKNNYFPKLESELNSIIDNVQGDEINKILLTIRNGFSDVCGALNEELPRLEEFLNEQISSYDKEENDVRDQLVDILNIITEHIYTVSYIGPAGILNVGNQSTPQEMVKVVEEFLRPESVLERQELDSKYRAAHCKELHANLRNTTGTINKNINTSTNITINGYKTTKTLDNQNESVIYHID